MKKFYLLTKTLLVAVCLLVGATNAWGATETLSGADTGTKDQPIAKTSFTLLGDYKPDDGSRTINTKSCMKVRWNKTVASTGNAEGFALKVNAGYMITKVIAQFSGNGKALTLGDIVIDGNNYAGSYTTTVPSNDSYAEITLSGITATDYINFTKASGDATQGYVYITATYVKVNQWDFTDSGIWGSITLPTAESNTKNYQYNGVEGTTLNYVTFYSSTGKIAHASSLSNGIAWTENGSTTDHYVKISVPAGKTARISVGSTSTRKMASSFNGTEKVYISNQTDDFVNSTASPIDLYVYCKANAATDKGNYLKSIALIETYAVTINYRDKDDLGNTLISSKVVNVEDGSSYTPTYTSPLYVSDSDPYEYTYYSGATETTITEATSFDILYSKSDRVSYTYTVNAIKNDDKAVIKQLTSGSMYKGSSVTIPYPACLKVGGTLYTRGATSSEFRQSASAAKDNDVITFPYVAQATTNVVYLVEGEDITGATKNTDGTNVAIRASNAATASIPDGGVAICTLPAGTYQLHLFMHHTKNNASVTTTFGYGETEFTVSTTGTNRVTADVKEFTLTETSELRCKSISGNGLLDNLYITGNVTATIGSMGYTTFASPYALNLSSMTASSGTATAYSVLAAGVDASEVTPTEATGNVAAGEGLILSGTAGATITIPVATSGDEISGNLMKGCPSGATITSSTPNYNNFYVLVNGTSEAVFKNLKDWIVGGNSVTIPEGKAYLDATGTSGANQARGLRISWGGITGVENVEAAEATAKKNGAYLENGKIAIYKNGMKYNANGQLIK